MKSRTNVKRFLVDWAAVLALLVCFIAFTAVKGSAFMSGSNMVNILRAMAINTVFGIAATITMAPDGFDMSAGTLASCSAYVFVSAYLWLGMSLGMSIVTCIFVTLIMYQLTMFLILVCKIPDMLATCALMFVHQGIGQWYIGGGAVSTGMKTSWGAMPARTALSESFSAIGRAPWIIIIMLGCVFVAYLFLNFTKHGRYLYAMGGNKEAAKLSGIDVKKYRYLAGIHCNRRYPGGIQRQFRPGHVLRQLPDAVAGSCFRGTYRWRRREAECVGNHDRRHAGVHAGKRTYHLCGAVLCPARGQGRRPGPGAYRGLCI